MLHSGSRRTVPGMFHRYGALLAVALILARPQVNIAQTIASGDTFAKAQQLAASHHLQHADDLLSQLVQRQPGNAVAWQQLGLIQTQRQLYRDAMRSFARALAIHPGLAAAKLGEIRAAVAYALTLRSAGHQNGALACLLRANRIVPDSPELLTDFGIQAYGMHIYKDADKALTRAHQLDPGNLTTLYALAHVELDEQNMPAAEKHLHAYLQRKPDDATAHYGLGHLLHMMSQDDAAVTELTRSIQLQPRQIASYYELGVIAMERQQIAEAKAEFTHVLAINPHHGGALTGMGILAFRSRHYKQAAQYLSKAVHYAADYVTAHTYYAMTLTRLGQKSEAARQMAQAQALTAQQDRLRGGYTIKKAP